MSSLKQKRGVVSLSHKTLGVFLSHSLVLLGLTLLLGSCAPRALGRSADKPFDLATVKQIELSRGGTYYLSGKFRARGTQLGDLPAPNGVYELGDEFKQVLSDTYTYELSSASLPEGWSLELLTVKGVHTVTNVRYRRGVLSRLRWEPSLEYNVALHTPDNLEPGRYRTRFTLDGPFERAYSFTITFTAKPS